MTSLLFVDDEAAVLSGLRRQLHHLRDEWDMTFVDSAEAALAHLEEHRIEAIITDIRMPRVGGVELLEVVRERHPETVRFVLSGQTCHRSSLQLTGLAHQFLAKPCDAEELRSAVRRTLDLRGRVGDPELVRIISGLRGLPASPTLYRKVIELANDETVPLGRIGELLERDPAMTAKILQLVNSAFFGLCREVSRPSQAASLLGLDTILTLVIGIEVFSTPVPPHVAARVERLHRESLRAATAASRIAQAEGWPKEQVNDAYLAAMLHDVGRLALTTALPDEYRPVGVARELLDWEAVAVGADHQQVGAYLIGLWGLPDVTVEAAAFHHEPSKATTRDEGPLLLAHVVRAVLDAGSGDPELDFGYLSECGVEDRIDGWIELVRDQIEGTTEPSDHRG